MATVERGKRVRVARGGGCQECLIIHLRGL
jgi:hypothetical protein